MCMLFNIYSLAIGLYSTSEFILEPKIQNLYTWEFPLMASEFMKKVKFSRVLLKNTEHEILVASVTKCIAKSFFLERQLINQAQHRIQFLLKMQCIAEILDMYANNSDIPPSKVNRLYKLKCIHWFILFMHNEYLFGVKEH